MISFQNLSLNTKVEPKGLQYLYKLKRNQTVQQIHKAIMNFVSKHSAKPFIYSFVALLSFFTKEAPIGSQRDTSIPLLQSFVLWREREEENGWEPQNPRIGVSLGYVYDRRCSLESRPLARAGSQTDARQTSNELMRERSHCFPICFNMMGQGMAFILVMSTESSGGARGTRWVGGPWPSLLTQFQVLTWLAHCASNCTVDCKNLQRAFPGAV